MVCPSHGLRIKMSLKTIFILLEFMAVFVNGDIHAMMMFHLLLTLLSLVRAEYWIQYVFEDARCIGDRPTNATIFARPINKASICYPSADGRGYALSTLSSGAYSMIAYTDRLCTNVDPKIRTTRFPSGVCTQGIIIRYVANDNMDTFAPPKGNDEVCEILTLNKLILSGRCEDERPVFGCCCGVHLIRYTRHNLVSL